LPNRRQLAKVRGLAARTCEGRQQNRHEQRDDADYQEQLDERESAPASPIPTEGVAG
jgi:hypothetical protein